MIIEGQKRSTIASRLAWEIHNGTRIASHLNANHYCHNHGCCNPDHLYQGTQQQNMRDLSLRIGPSKRRRPTTKIGTVFSRQKLRQPEAERFWRKVVVCQHGIDCPYCCWGWNAGRKSYGYGSFSTWVNGKLKHIAASRMMWQLINKRPMPKGYFALHHCDTTICTNPWHLYQGTHKQNMQDASRRKRIPVKRGSENHFAKVREADIALIWQMHTAGKTTEEISQVVPLHPTYIGQILRWSYWAEISAKYSNEPVILGPARGERNSAAVLKNVDIPRIWTMHKDGRSQQFIAQELRVSEQSIYRVLTFTNWVHISHSCHALQLPAVQLSLFET